MNHSDLKLIEINHHNEKIFKNLAQAYEAAFSDLTHKMPDELGLFNIDTPPNAPYVGYLLFYQDKPVGFCVADIESEIKDIAEFYIIPVMRKKNLGYKLAVMIFNKHPGDWQVRQIEGAIDAINFWRRVINKYTRNRYEESMVKDEHWGTVTRQRFQAPTDEACDESCFA
jgi:predicted acetyltransferase